MTSFSARCNSEQDAAEEGVLNWNGHSRPSGFHPGDEVLPGRMSHPQWLIYRWVQGKGRSKTDKHDWEHRKDAAPDLNVLQQKERAHAASYNHT